MAEYSSTELMAVVAARALEDGKSVFVGTGLPMIAAVFAQRTHAPRLLIVFEAGGIGPRVPVLPVSVAESKTFHQAVAASSMHEVMSLSQAGYLDYGFLGAAAIDRYGNINTTVIGDYRQPRVRLPGSGGACEIAIHARKVFVITRLSKRTFVQQLDFCTSPGHLSGKPGERAALGMPGAGPQLVVTDKAIFRFDQDTGEMVLSSVHPGVTVEEVRAEVSWPLKVTASPKVTKSPTAKELRIIREELDPDGIYTTCFKILPQEDDL